MADGKFLYWNMDKGIFCGAMDCEVYTVFIADLNIFHTDVLVLYLLGMSIRQKKKKQL